MMGPAIRGKLLLGLSFICAISIVLAILLPARFPKEGNSKVLVLKRRVLEAIDTTDQYQRLYHNLPEPIKMSEKDAKRFGIAMPPENAKNRIGLLPDSVYNSSGEMRDPFFADGSLPFLYIVGVNGEAILISAGGDGKYDSDVHVLASSMDLTTDIREFEYDPTNGTRQSTDLIYLLR